MEGNPSLLLSLTISIVLLLLIRIIFEGEDDIDDDIDDDIEDIDETDVDTDGWEEVDFWGLLIGDCVRTPCRMLWTPTPGRLRCGVEVAWESGVGP